MQRKFLRMMDPMHSHDGHRAPAGLWPVLSAAFVWLFICIWFTTQCVKYNYEINDLTKKVEKLRVQNRTMEYRLQSMMSGDKIGEVAKQRYGFKDASRSQVIIVSRQRSILDKLGRAIGNMFSKEKEI